MSKTRRSGFTLIEILIGATLTLILLGVMIRAFTFAGNEISKGRAVIELSNELRTAAETMRHDLRSATSKFLPWTSIGSDEGYVEYVEGPTRDYTFANTNDPLNQGSPLNSFGDGDDILMLTCRNLEQPYQGLSSGAVIESKVAEIAWWANYVNGDGSTEQITIGGLPTTVPNLSLGDSVTLNRRVLLVVPSLNQTLGGESYITSFRLKNATETPFDYIAAFLQSNDVSARYDATISTGTGGMVANSLADLTRRENRFAHNFVTFPHPIVVPNLALLTLTGDRAGEDVMLSNVSGFDLKIFDPTAAVRGATKADGTTVALTPSDPGYFPQISRTTSPYYPATAYPIIHEGAYVDLGYQTIESYGVLDAGSKIDTNLSDLLFERRPAVYASSTFSGLPATKSFLGTGGLNSSAVYCTWSSHYERDGINQDLNYETANGLPIVIDQGTNGVDDQTIAGTTNGVDDELERETSPPYPFPLRGMKVTFRVRDPGSQQVRQTSVEASFVPE